MTNARPRGATTTLAPPWNAEEMERLARASETKECYRELFRGDGYRLGIVASALPSSCVLFSIEVSLRLCRTDREVKPALLVRVATLSRILQRRGYSVNHLDDGWIVCEKAFFKEEVAREQGFLHRSIQPVGGASDPQEVERVRRSSGARRG